VGPPVCRGWRPAMPGNGILVNEHPTTRVNKRLWNSNTSLWPMTGQKTGGRMGPIRSTGWSRLAPTLACHCWKAVAQGQSTHVTRAATWPQYPKSSPCPGEYERMTGARTLHLGRVYHSSHSCEVPG